MKGRSAIVVHGHRGSRGTHPENTIPSFEEARDSGAGAIELDVHLSADDHPVVFHDAVISSKLCTDPRGNPVEVPRALREMSFLEIQRYECGGIAQPQFSEQKPITGVRIPTLEQVLEWKVQKAPKLFLNIEIKYESTRPDLLPTPEMIAGRVIILLRKYQLVQTSLVQSFDFRVVKAARKMEPLLKLSCLFEHDADFGSVAFETGAQVAATDYKLLTPEKIQACKHKGIEVLPWTVNDPADWKKLIDWGVDGIITDYPRKLVRFISD